MVVQCCRGVSLPLMALTSASLPFAPVVDIGLVVEEGVLHIAPGVDVGLVVQLVAPTKTDYMLLKRRKSRVWKLGMEAPFLQGAAHQEARNANLLQHVAFCKREVC